MVGYELMPGRDYAGGISAQLAHVGELHSPGIGAQLGLERPDLRAADHDERRLLPRHAVADERQRSAKESVLAGVEQRLVTK